MATLTFRVNRPYDPKLDVRDREDLFVRTEGLPQNGVLWPLVAARRAGKTWTLQALLHRWNELSPGSARYLDLRRPNPNFGAPGQHQCLLLDEPGEFLQNNGRGFLEHLNEFYRDNVIIVAAMTPAEWELIRDIGERSAHISPKDLLFLSPLGAPEAQRLARTAMAATLLSTLPPNWTRNPFLLELLFETAERYPERAGTPRELIRAVLDRCDDEENFYFKTVFLEGLSPSQRVALKHVARALEADPLEAPERGILERCGLIQQDMGQVFTLGDPVLEAYLSPLRIHHISDIHIGPKAAEMVWVKEKGTHGERLGKGAGSGPVRESYLNHLRALHAQGRAPHLIFVSGDITETGEPEQYQAAKEWFSALRDQLAEHSQLNENDPRILLVGGNHDVDWRQSLGTHDARARHQPFAEAFRDYPRPKLEVDPKERTLASVSYPDLGVEILLLGSAEFGGEEEKDPDRAEVLKVVDKLRERAALESDVLESLKLRDRVARIDPGLVHHADLQKAKEHPWKQPIRIAMLHHPVSPLPATEISRYSGLINAGEVKDALLHRGFCMVLHGHAHTAWFGCEQWPGRHKDRSIYVAAAASLGSREVQEHHGFNEIEVLRDRRGEKAQYHLVVRRFLREGTETWVEKGEMEFTPP